MRGLLKKLADIETRFEDTLAHEDKRPDHSKFYKALRVWWFALFILCGPCWLVWGGLGPIVAGLILAPFYGFDTAMARTTVMTLQNPWYYSVPFIALTSWLPWMVMFKKNGPGDEY